VVKRSAREKLLPCKWEELRCAFKRLDKQLEAAIATFNATHGGPVTDLMRGLVITPEQCGTLLRLEPGLSPMASRGGSSPLWPRIEGSTAERLATLFCLEAFDLDVLLLSLACELDLRYERLFAYLQDDVTRKRPTVDLALNLLCAGGTSRAEGRERFDASAPLLRHGLIELLTDPHAAHPPLLSRYVCPDAQIVRWLLGSPGLDARLASACRLESPPWARLPDLFLPAAVLVALDSWVRRVRQSSATQCAWLHGPKGGEGLRASRAVAQMLGSRLLRLDATRVNVEEVERSLRLAQNEAWFGGSLLCIEHAETWAADDRLFDRIAGHLAGSSCSVVMLSTQRVPTPLLGSVYSLEMPMPDSPQRERCWSAALSGHHHPVDARVVQTLATSYRLMPAQVAAAVADAHLRSDDAPSLQDLRCAARTQCGNALTAVSIKVNARATWDDIVLPNDAVAQLRELCTQVEQSERVFDAWGFGRKLSRGRGTTALFSGGSGTGKTMAAEVIANALGMDLYRIDLARVVNKYIGETEKNLDRVFSAAEGANAILFFDEADALFGRRSEVNDAHDRYANIEVSYLLQKMEEYDGIAILASNLADNLDDAFTRRLSFAIHFPLPDEATRLEIWRRAWPAEARVAESVDRGALARELKIAGGGIKNIALGAAFSAAGNGGVIDDEHVASAVRRELHKVGRASTIPPRFAARRAP